MATVLVNGHPVTIEQRLVERSWCDVCLTSSLVRVRVLGLCEHGVTRIGEAVWCTNAGHRARCVP